MPVVKTHRTSLSKSRPKARPRLRFAPTTLRSSVKATPSHVDTLDSVYTDSMDSRNAKAASGLKGSDSKFTAIFTVAKQIQLAADQSDFKALRSLSKIFTACLYNILRSFKTLPSELRSTSDFAIAFKAVVHFGTQFTSQVKLLTAKLSDEVLAEELQMTVQSLDMSMSSFTALLDLVDRRVAINKPLPSPPSSILSLDRALSPSIHNISSNESLVSSASSSSPLVEEGPVSPISAEIVDVPPVKGKMSKGSLTRLITGLRTRRSIRQMTASWLSTGSKPSTPLAELSPLIRQFPTPPTPPTPTTAGSNESSGSNRWPIVLQSDLDDDFATSKDGLCFGQSGSLCAASLAGLVRVLTSMEAVIDPTFTNVFFHSFRFFTTSKELFDMLLVRYNETSPPDLTSERLARWEQANITKMRVAKVFLLWLRNHWRYEWDVDVLEPLRKFASSRPAGDAASITWPKVLHKIKEASVGVAYRGNRMERQLYNAAHLQEVDPPPTSFQPLSKDTFILEKFGEVDILYFHNPAGHEEFARQLSLAASQLFRHFDPEDAVRYWKDGLSKSVGESVFRFTSFENALTYWTANSIVTRPTSRSRSEVMEFFIEIAYVCPLSFTWSFCWLTLTSQTSFQLRNFACACAMSAGISLCMTRLHETSEVSCKFFA